MARPTVMTEAVLDKLRQAFLVGATKDLHMHHVRPRHLTGDDNQSNIMILCGECHRDWHYALDKVLSNYWQGRI